MAKEHHGRTAFISSAAYSVGRLEQWGIAEDGVEIAAIDLNDASETVKQVEPTERRLGHVHDLNDGGAARGLQNAVTE